MSLMTSELEEKNATLEGQEAIISSLRQSEARLSKRVNEQTAVIQELQAKVMDLLREVPAISTFLSMVVLCIDAGVSCTRKEIATGALIADFTASYLECFSLLENLIMGMQQTLT